MALHYIFLGEKTDKFNSKFYDGLIWGTMGAGINYLCEETADEFVRRLNILQFFTEPIKKEDLIPYYGLRTNASNETAKEWAIRQFANKWREGSKYNATWIKKINKLAWTPENIKKENEIIARQEKAQAEKETTATV